MNEKSITGVGIMSGSSMDGLDLALASFHYSESSSEWHYDLHKAELIPYTEGIDQMLRNAPKMNPEGLLNADSVFGRWIGIQTKDFIEGSKHTPHFIASHGHTIFHNPSLGYSYQLGKGEEIYSETQVLVINDFRSMDISLGGEGAPLVPAFDFLVMKEYDACINLGGISNITINNQNTPLAADICGTNQLLNYLSNRIGLKYDANGKLASEGEFDRELYNELVENPFLDQPFPKSLSNEMVKERDLKVLSNYSGSIENGLNTICTFIGIEINKVLAHYLPEGSKILLSGGGALNDELVQKIRDNNLNYEFIIPESDLINYKEAIAFAFLGVLRIKNEINCFASVTGARSDSVCGRMIGN